MAIELACPLCEGSYSLAQAMEWAQGLLQVGFSGVSTCPLCGGEYTVNQSGDVETARQIVDRFSGTRRLMVEKMCACGCKKSFQTRHKDKVYLNTAHARRGQRKGLIFQPEKCSV